MSTENKIYLVTSTREDTSTCDSTTILTQKAFRTPAKARKLFEENLERITATTNESEADDWHRSSSVNLDSGWIAYESKTECLKLTIRWDVIDFVDTEEGEGNNPRKETLYLEVEANGIKGGQELALVDNSYRDSNDDFVFDLTARPNFRENLHWWKTTHGEAVNMLATDGEYYTVYTDFRDIFIG